MASKYSESVIDAMAKLLSNRADSVGTDIVQATIMVLKDAKTNLYTLSYNNAVIEAYATSGNRFNKDDKVYVLVPNGNFSEDKIILMAAPVDKKDEIFNENASEYITIDNDIFNLPADIISLCSYRDDTKSIINSNDAAAAQKLKEYLNNGYVNFNVSMDIRTSLPQEQQKDIGNYGLKITFPFYRIDENKNRVPEEKIIIFDTTQFLGTPYAFDILTNNTMSFILKEEESYKYDETAPITIVAFDNSFPNKSEQMPDDIFLSNIQIGVQRKLTKEEMQSNSLVLVTTKGGPFFFPNDLGTEKQIVPILKIKGQDTSVQGYDCYWGKKDNKTHSGDKNYCKYLGNGWECLNEKVIVDKDNDGNPIYNYTTNTYTLTVSKDDVYNSVSYKCIITDGTNEYSDIITIENKTNNIKVELVTENGSTKFTKDISIPIKLIARTVYPKIDDSSKFTVAWRGSDARGNDFSNDFIRVIDESKSNTEYSQTGEIMSSIIGDSATIQCTIFYDGNIWGSSQLHLSTGAIEGYEVEIIGGSRTFYYDMDGNSPYDKGKYGKDTDNVMPITLLQYKIYKEDGTELLNEEYNSVGTEWRIPKNSLFIINSTIVDEKDDYYIVREKSLSYSLAGRYNVNKSQNDTITLITNYNGREKRNYTTLKCIKEGVNGTNGTNYYAEILMNGYAYGEKNNITGDYVKVKYVCNIYEKDGKDAYAWYYHNMETGQLIPIENEEYGAPLIEFRVRSMAEELPRTRYELKEIKMFDRDDVMNSLFTFSNSEIQIAKSIYYMNDNKKEKSNDNDSYIKALKQYCKYDKNPSIMRTSNIIQAEIQVSEEDSSKHFWNIYCYYPIEVTFIYGRDISKDNNNYIPIINGGFTEVIYSTAGTNPSYENSSDFNLKFNRAASEEVPEEEIGDITEIAWDTSKNLSIIKKKADDNQSEFVQNIKPINYFKDGDSNNYIQTTFEYNEDIRYTHYKPILLLLNRYNLSSDLNAWDGNKIYLNNDGDMILAPQVGAGIKEADNSFTGMIMGTRKIDGITDIGLFGYKNTVQTSFIDATDGSVVLGSVGSGLLSINPSAGTGPEDIKCRIHSGNYYKTSAYSKNGKINPKYYDDYEEIIPSKEKPYCHWKYKLSGETNGEGMEIDFAKPFIRYGSGNFEVDPEGCMIAKNAEIQGKISADGGNVGKWIVSDAGSLYSRYLEHGKKGEEREMILQADGTIVLYHGYIQEGQEPPSVEYALGSTYDDDTGKTTPFLKLGNYTLTDEDLKKLLELI